MAARNPLANVRSTTVGIIALTGLWTAFQVFDKTPPPALDQILVAAFGIWFATEAKRNKPKPKQVKKTASEDVREDDDA